MTADQARKLDQLAADIQALPADRQEALREHMERRAYTVKEVAESLAVHVETIRRWIRSGQIRAVRLGGGPKAPVRITDEELDRLLHGEYFVRNADGSLHSTWRANELEDAKNLCDPGMKVYFVQNGIETLVYEE